MKKPFKNLLLFVVFLIFVVGLSSCSKKVDSAVLFEDAQRCGGYSGWISPISEEAYFVFKSVVKGSEYETCEPAKVSLQIVAGVNYRFDCGEKVITIFQPLPGCGDPEITAVKSVEK